MDVIAYSHGERSFLCLFICFTLTDLVSSDLTGLSLRESGTIRIMDCKHEVSNFIVKSDTLGRWETGTHFEKLFGDDFLAIIEFV